MFNFMYMYCINLTRLYSICLQACLAAKAKPNERNRVEVTTTDISQNSVTYSILSLKSGETEQVANSAVLKA